MSSNPNRFDRYLAIIHWLRRRYTRDGRLTISVGGIPSAFSRLELAFARRYLRIHSESIRGVA
jgi:hypothetical protein